MIRLVATPDECSRHIRDKIIRLDEICFPHDIRVNPARCFWWIDEENGRPVAFAALRPCLDQPNKGLGYLSRAGVLRSWRGQGRQKRLIRRRLSHAKRLGLREVVTYTTKTNLASANSLISCGFRLYVPGTRWGGAEALYFKKKI